MGCLTHAEKQLINGRLQARDVAGCEPFSLISLPSSKGVEYDCFRCYGRQSSEFTCAAVVGSGPLASPGDVATIRLLSLSAAARYPSHQGCRLGFRTDVLRHLRGWRTPRDQCSNSCRSPRRTDSWTGAKQAGHAVSSLELLLRGRAGHRVPWFADLRDKMSTLNQGSKELESLSHSVAFLSLGNVRLHRRNWGHCRVLSFSSCGELMPDIAFLIASAIPPVIAAIVAVYSHRRAEGVRDRGTHVRNAKVVLVLNGKQVEFEPTREESDRLQSIVSAHASK